MVPIEKHQIVAVAAVKRFQEIILGYKGPPNKLREYLLKQMDHWQSKGDAILADIIDDIL